MIFHIHFLTFHDILTHSLCVIGKFSNVLNPETKNLEYQKIWHFNVPRYNGEFCDIFTSRCIYYQTFYAGVSFPTFSLQKRKNLEYYKISCHFNFHFLTFFNYETKIWDFYKIFICCKRRQNHAKVNRD